MSVWDTRCICLLSVLFSISAVSSTCDKRRSSGGQVLPWVPIGRQSYLRSHLVCLSYDRLCISSNPFVSKFLRIIFSIPDSTCLFILLNWQIPWTSHITRQKKQTRHLYTVLDISLILFGPVSLCLASTTFTTLHWTICYITTSSSLAIQNLDFPEWTSLKWPGGLWRSSSS